MIAIFIAGFVGGALRGVVGYVKYQTSYKGVPFRFVYFLGMSGVSAVVGALAAWVTQDLGLTFLGMSELSPAVAFIIGYAGGDFIENLFKILTGKASLYDFPKA